MSEPDVDHDERARQILGFSRWWQLAAAAAAMAAVSPYQYVWSSIQGPIAERVGVALPALAVTFSLYVLFQSGSQFPAGWLRDRRGPRALTVLAAVLAGTGYVGLAYATQLWQVYLLYSLGAVGVGIVYTVAVNTAVKWFPDRSGLATGVGTMAFAAGSTALVPYVRANATVSAYPNVLRTVGLLILVVLVAGAAVLRDPPAGWATGASGGATTAERDADRAVAEDDAAHAEDAAGDADSDAGGTDANAEEPDALGPDGASTDRGYTWRELLGTWQFWLCYGTFVAISGADLLVIAQVVDFAERVGFAATVATAAATVLPLASGVSRLVLGEISDRFRRESVMAASFLLAGAFRFAMVYAASAGSEPAFVLTVVLAMFFSSPLYAFFPSLVADYYGTSHSSGNYALLYTAKVLGGVVAGSVAGLLVALTGWFTTFAVGGGLAILAGLAAAVLRPPGDDSANPEAASTDGRA